MGAEEAQIGDVLTEHGLIEARRKRRRLGIGGLETLGWPADMFRMLVSFHEGVPNTAGPKVPMVKSERPSEAVRGAP